MQFDRPKFIYFEEISSTNEYLKNNYQNLNSLTFIRSDYQTNGVGQFLRVWQSEKQKNLLFSLILKDLTINKLQKIKKIVIDILIAFLKTLNINGTFVEPNDIFVNNKKILGILIETKITNNFLNYLIIGIGINVNQTTFDNIIATSVKLETKQEYQVQKLYKLLVNDLITTFSREL